MMGRSLVDAPTGTDVPRTIFQQLSYEGNHEMRAGVDAYCHVIYNASPDTSWEVYLSRGGPGDRAGGGQTDRSYPQAEVAAISVFIASVKGRPN
jgi:hypothetical protein